jgi:hypothetical protein
MDEYFFWGLGKPYDDYSDPYGDWIDEMELMFEEVFGYDDIGKVYVYISV